RIDHRLEARTQGVVTIGGELWRAPRCGRERGQLTGDLQRQPIKVLRVQCRARGQMRDDRLVAIDDLEHEEVGNLGSSTTPRSDSASGKRLGPLVQQSL